MGFLVSYPLCKELRSYHSLLISKKAEKKKRKDTNEYKELQCTRAEASVGTSARVGKLELSLINYSGLEWASLIDKTPGHSVISGLNTCDFLSLNILLGTKSKFREKISYF